jgi:hypothetical protein
MKFAKSMFYCKTKDSSIKLLKTSAFNNVDLVDNPPKSSILTINLYTCTLNTSRLDIKLMWSLTNKDCDFFQAVLKPYVHVYP